MSRILVFVFVCLSNLLSIASYASQAIIIDEGNGFKKLKIEAASLDSISIMQVAPSANSLKVYTFNTLGGVLETDLPSWLVDEIFLDHGFDSWQDADDVSLNAAIPSIVVDIDEVNAMTAQQSGDVNVSGLCGGRWTNEHSFYAQDLDNFFDAAQVSSGNNLFNSSLGGSIKATGKAAVDFRYKLRRNRCTFNRPYRMQYDYTDINVKATIERSKVDYSGTANTSYEGDILAKNIKLLEFEHSFWAHLAEVNITSTLNLNIGIELQAQAAIAFEGNFHIEGNAHLSYRCYLKRCNKLSNVASFNLEQVQSPTFESEFNVVVRPYADFNANADLELFWKSIDLAEMKIGIVSSLPARLFAYSGNNCGDANSDGKNEWVNAAMLDVNFETYMYLITDVIGKKHYSSLNLNLPKLSYYRRTSSEINESKSSKVYYKNIYFKDLISSGSNIFEPMINMPDVVASTDAGAIISSRPCYPLKAKPIYEIDWGDGYTDRLSLNTTGTYLKHDWPYLGDVNVTARIVSDEAGRTINSSWTHKIVNVSPDGNYPFYPWLPAIISSTLL